MGLWTSRRKTDRQRMGRGGLITFISTRKSEGTYRKEAKGRSQCTLVCVAVVAAAAAAAVGVCVSWFCRNPPGVRLGVAGPPRHTASSGGGKAWSPTPPSHLYALEKEKDGTG